VQNCAADRLLRLLPPDTVRITSLPEGCRLAISAAIDLEYSQHLQRLLTEVIDCLSPDDTLIIDLEHVPYISSTGVGALANTLIEARNRNILLYLSRVQPKVRAVFQILGLMVFFKEVP